MRLTSIDMTTKPLLILVVTAAVLPFHLSAQTSLSVGNVPGYPGATVSVPVSLRQPAGSAAAAQFDVAFNAGKVSAGAPVATARLANHTVRSREIAPGVRRTLVYSLTNAAVAGTNGAIVTLPFTVSPQETVGSGPLTPDNVILARADGTALAPVSLGAGTIFVRPVNPLPDGTVQFFLPSTNDQRYAIQATTNFVEWLNISTNTATGDFINLLDPGATNHPYRFYRWELLSQ
jgi:hypothetical protein